MENFRDKMRQTFSTPNKPNSAFYGVFWSVLECFGVVLRCRGGVNTCRNGTGACVAMTDTQRQNSGWGVPAGRFGIFQFVAKFATGRNRRRGLRNNDKDT